ncbi:MAG TPA: hypothetical protein VKB27_02225 [Gammaproteobacteria bacterium]|nr:hypothetical protein [Gammaproteobacteria bacterium]
MGKTFDDLGIFENHPLDGSGVVVPDGFEQQPVGMQIYELVDLWRFVPTPA